MYFEDVYIVNYIFWFLQKYILHKSDKCSTEVDISYCAIRDRQFQTCHHFLLCLAIKVHNYHNTDLYKFPNIYSLVVNCMVCRMESVKLSNPYSIAKVTGVVICLAGVFVIAFYAGPALSPVNHHRAFHASQTSSNPMRRVTWIKGTFLKLLGDIIWCLWIIAQVCSWPILHQPSTSNNCKQNNYRTIMNLMIFWSVGRLRC